MTETNKGATWLRRTAGLALRLLVAGVLIGYLVHSQRANLVKALEGFNYIYLLPALAIYLGHMFISGLRWCALARVLKIPLTRGEAIVLTLRGYFCSLFIPGGAIGGDVARIGFLAARSEKGKRFESALTVAMDRVVGMVALFGLTLILALCALPTLLRVNLPGITLSPGVRYAGIGLLLAVCAAGLLVPWVLFFHAALRRIWGVDWLFRHGDRLSGGLLSRVTVAADWYRKEWRLLIFWVVVSVFFIHLLTQATVFCLIAGLGLGGYSVLTVFAAAAIANIAGLLPGSFSGVGFRDVIFFQILVAGGLADAATIPLLYTAVMIVANLIAGLCFVFDFGTRREPGVNE